MIDLTSDTDDEQLNVKAQHNPPARIAPIVDDVDSDDGQPLEALKRGLKHALSSRSSLQASDASQGAADPPAQPAAAVSKPVKKLTSKKAAASHAAAQRSLHEDQTAGAAAAPLSSKYSQRGKENLGLATTAGSLGSGGGGAGAAAAAAAAASHDDCDLDNWCLEPLQRRLNGRAGRLAASSSQAAAGGSGGGTSTSRADSIGQQQQQDEQHVQQQEEVQGQEQEPWQQLPRSQDSQQQQPQEDSPSSDPTSRAAAASRKRQRQQPAGSFVDSQLDSDADGDDCSAGTAAAAAAAGGRAAKASRARASGRSAAAAAAAGSSGGGSSRVRMSKEERAALKAAEKARKEAEKVAAKLARQAEVEATKAAKRFETFAARKANGNFCEQEVVLLMDATTSATALGLALAAELDRRKTMAWQVVPQLPLSGRWPGCCCFCFKRRKLCEGDEHEVKTAVSTKLEQFHEDVAPPYVQLVFEQPAAFLAEVQRDRLAGLMAAVAGSHAAVTLGVLVLGLKSHVQRLDNQNMRQRVPSHWDWRRVNDLLLELHLTTPGLQLRLMSKLDEAATHIVNTLRVIGQQPYSVENQLEACGGAGPGAASKAAASSMAADLGPTTCDFAVSTLGKMHGMGGNKAWAVAKSYPSFGAMIAGFQRAAAAGGQPALLLQDLMEPAGSGKAKPRRVGPAMSKRLHLLLACEDPDAIVEGGEGDD